MCTYYNLDEKAGITLKGKSFGDRYAFLTNEELVKRLVDFADDHLYKITLYIPSIHCSSCIWLLENLYKLRDGIKASRVNFLKKEIAVSFNPAVISLQKLVELLATLGYEPLISLEDYEKKTQQQTSYSIYLKLGITAFCTGNSMVLSFPEYFGIDGILEYQYRTYFVWLNVLLSLPVFFYGASDYFLSAYQSLKEKVINLDVPISIGIFTLFGRSLFETVTGMGPGYWDSLSGLILFLLAGKWIQHKTYEHLSFERNYQSYFPLAVTRLIAAQTENIPVSQLQTGDRIIIRNQEIIPADSVLSSPKAWIDYSFVTGESEPVEKKTGDYVYAGGRQVGSSIELQVQKPVSQSYLTQLWNNEAFAKEKVTPVTKLAADFSRYFTYITLTIALLTGIYWSVVNPDQIWNAVTAVLIVACPCALSLSMPFTMGSAMSILGKRQFFVKSPAVIQHLAAITHIVFDKTGTLTQTKGLTVSFAGTPLTAEEKRLIASVTTHSTHPLSQKVYRYLAVDSLYETEFFHESEGKGVEAIVEGKLIKLGSAAFVGLAPSISVPGGGQRVFVSINHVYKGVFQLETHYRPGLERVMAQLKPTFRLSLLSGDHATEKAVLQPLFGSEATLLFEQSPMEKLAYIQHLQAQGEKVLMIGDGLNDAGALKQSDVGLALTDDINAFFPASDALMQASQFTRLAELIRFCRTSVNLVKVSFLVSMIYNCIGLSLAISGNLSPVVAAILMPVSSITVVLSAVGLTNWYGRKIKKELLNRSGNLKGH
jgi:Cu+-exporting ATPase